jgi:hypothetical protein
VTITKETPIEELVTRMPGAVQYLMTRGIRCMVCGEPMWGTLEAAALEKGFSDTDIASFVQDLVVMHNHSSLPRDRSSGRVS